MTALGMGDDQDVGSRPAETRSSALRSFHHRDFEVAALVAARAGRRVAVCLPARNEAGTVGPIVASVRGELTRAGGGVDLVDDVVVIDDGSDDDTAAVARGPGPGWSRPGPTGEERARPWPWRWTPPTPSSSSSSTRTS